jgi:hypothetical protein
VLKRVLGTFCVGFGWDRLLPIAAVAVDGDDGNVDNEK